MWLGGGTLLLESIYMYGSPAAQPASGSTLIYLHKTFRRPELQPNKEGNVTYDVIPCMGL